MELESQQGGIKVIDKAHSECRRIEEDQKYRHCHNKIENRSHVGRPSLWRNRGAAAITTEDFPQEGIIAPAW
jgi:hypothetical protein